MSSGGAPMRRATLPPRRSIIALIVILFALAFLVSRSCQHREVRIDQQRAIAIAREQIDYEPDRAAVRLIRQGIPSRAYWAVSLPKREASARDDGRDQRNVGKGRQGHARAAVSADSKRCSGASPTHDCATRPSARSTYTVGVADAR